MKTSQFRTSPVDGNLQNGQRLSPWRVNSTYVQTLLVGVVLFCCPGTYLAITGLGAGGNRSEMIPIVNKSNVILYSLFGLSGVFGGSVINQIGPRYTLMIGAAGYPIYAGSLWWIDTGAGTWFTLFGGAALGLSAGLLWATQGYITTCYPTEKEKGKYIATSWIINALGSVVGAAMILGVTVTDTSVSGVPSAVYITFICLESAGVAIAAFLLNPSSVRRSDGRPIAEFKPLPWRKELMSLAKTVLEPRMALITLSIFSSEMYLSMVGSFNVYYFNARTRALANLVYWIFQILGALLISYVCDTSLLSTRRHRAAAAASLVLLVVGGTWIAMTSFLSSTFVNRHAPPRGTDWSDPDFTGPFVIYIFFGACYPIFQNYHHWLYSTFSNEPRVLGRYSGYFKGVQAWGTATAFGIDSNQVAFLKQAAVYFSLMMGGLVMSAGSMYRYTTNTNYGLEEGVVVPEGFDEQHAIKQVESGEPTVEHRCDTLKE